MERFGFIHEKLDIKILILFILSRLPGEVPPEVLGELCQCDDGIGYFDYSDCLAELVETEHITETETGYTITSTQDGSVVKFAFHEEDNSWSLDQDGKSIKFMTFIDDSHVKMLTPDGDFQTVELSQAGVYAYRQMVTGNYFAMK